MTDDDPNKPPAPGWPWLAAWSQAWSHLATPWAGLAPQVLTQPINPGWSFGNITVTQLNSSSPDVEGAILARHSYGRQIGRMMDALSALVEAAPELAADERIASFAELAQDVAEIKGRAREARLGRLRAELRELRDRNPAAWATLRKELEG